MNKKLIFYSLLFFLIGAATFLFFFHQNINKTPHTAIEPVITPATYKKLSLTPNIDTSSWETFTDPQQRYTIKYPDTISLDSRQTVEGRINVFVFTEDQKKDSQLQVPALYIVNTHKNGADGFSAFMKGDCKQPCKMSYKTAEWVNINNVYGIKNPLSGDVSNYYLTDKDQKGIVINAYVGNYKNTANPDAKKKMDTFEQMIRTIQFEKSQNHAR
jgi:hypothetical protein